ncbi:hypothetical protein LCGC14_0164370 [marine sediment metagenome]|uniref:Uncharacterized protein n=1 Tax=marine sediment metagenome TaxID=412755 RepID=A0A0F9XWM8_9ZZZZ
MDDIPPPLPPPSPLTRADVAAEVAESFKDYYDEEDRGKLEVASVEGIDQYVRSLNLYFVMGEMDADSGGRGWIAEIWVDEAKAEERATYIEKRGKPIYKYPTFFSVQEINLGEELEIHNEDRDPLPPQQLP